MHPSLHNEYVCGQGVSNIAIVKAAAVLQNHRASLEARVGSTFNAVQSVVARPGFPSIQRTLLPLWSVAFPRAGTEGRQRR